MAIPPHLSAFWAAAEQARPDLDRGRFLEAFAFGDNERLANELARLVLSGAKKATASLAWTHEFDRKLFPKPGDLSIVTSWGGEPLCIIETTAIEIVAFDQVLEAFVREEGEGDGTLASWRRSHALYFGRECARIGRVPAPDMPVLCERFRVVFQPGT